MTGIEFLPGFILGVREGLEAFLIIGIMLEFVKRSNRSENKKYVYQGLIIGIGFSIVFGGILLGISNYLGANSDSVAKLWESIASFVALILITTFIYFMITSGNRFVSNINEKISKSPNTLSIISLAAIMVAREGTEISLFLFVKGGEEGYLSGIIIGLIIAALLSYLIYKSLIKVNIKLIFRITLFYLILQAGFLLGYSIHELLSLLKDKNILQSTNVLYTKMFDLSDTFLYHKEEPLGILLYATIGWYSKPEIIQFILQYMYTFTLIFLFLKPKK